MSMALTCRLFSPSGRVTEGGRNLSAGQRGRLTLARALLGKPPILLLDEADANLDGESEKLIQRVLESYTGTVLMVSHRQTALSQIDQVWHLDTTETEAQQPVNLCRFPKGTGHIINAAS